MCCKKALTCNPLRGIVVPEPRSPVLTAQVLPVTPHKRSHEEMQQSTAGQQE